MQIIRYLAIDLGDRRTGLAVGDTFSNIVSPAGQLEQPIAHQQGQLLLAAIAKAVLVHGAHELVVGMPYNMDGTEGPRAKGVRAFAARIAERTAKPVVFADERLTTAAADWEMAGADLTYGKKKAQRDQLAACILLRDYLKARKLEREGPAGTKSRSDE